ncbi:MAG: hypothetical protein K8L99_30855 [Anaerolineae bacterium]|nr:hypothetical protein [Anaerolineae bacterium]
MTPTLGGRWQSRIFILGTAGLIVTLLFGAVIGNYVTPLLILGVVIVAGFFWDALYTFLQTYRWDQDWPPAYVLFAGIFEGIMAGIIINVIPGFPLPTIGQFVVHYSLVWIASYIMQFSIMRVLFPRWRYYGGRVV